MLLSEGVTSTFGGVSDWSSAYSLVMRRTAAMRSEVVLEVGRGA